MASQQQDLKATEATVAPGVPVDIETEPVAVAGAGQETSIPAKEDEDPFLVKFHETYDGENPKDWPKGRKWAVTDSLSATGFNRIMVSTIMAPALTTIQADLNMSSTESSMALSIYLLATAFGPLFIGPLSEVYGRKYVLHASNAWFVLWNLVCGFAKTKGTLIAARFLAGFGASSIYALGGSVLGDIWRPEERGRGLRIYLMIQLLGSAVGPIVGGFMAGRTTWRWMFWATTIFQVVMILVTWSAVLETHAPTILQKRAEKMRRETGNQNFRTVWERVEDKQPLRHILWRALTRPVRLMIFHPIVQIVSVISAFNYGLLYIVLSSFATLWIEQYHEAVATSGLHYIACALGEVLGSQAGGPLMDRLFRRMVTHHSTDTDGEHVPEFRMPLTVPGAVLGPVGLFVYGWCAQGRTPWAAVDLAACLLTAGFQVGGMPLQAYLIDAYPEHVGSALAAAQFLRSLTAFAFPLFAPTMYTVLGYGWGNSLLAFAGLAVGLPAPLLLWFFGAKLRAKAGETY